MRHNYEPITANFPQYPKGELNSGQGLVNCIFQINGNKGTKLERNKQDVFFLGRFFGKIQVRASLSVLYIALLPLCLRTPQLWQMARQCLSLGKQENFIRYHSHCCFAWLFLIFWLDCLASRYSSLLNQRNYLTSSTRTVS